MPMPLTVTCFSKIQIGFTFLVPTDPGSPGKGPLNKCVCSWGSNLSNSPKKQQQITVCHKLLDQALLKLLDVFVQKDRATSSCMRTCYAQFTSSFNVFPWWYGMVNVNLYSAVITKVSNGGAMHAAPFTSQFNVLVFVGAKLQLGPSCRLPTASPGRWIGGRPPDMVASCDLSG